jgi:hypothetical protein
MIEGVLAELAREVDRRIGASTSLSNSAIDELVDDATAEIRLLLDVECDIEWVP